MPFGQLVSSDDQRVQLVLGLLDVLEGLVSRVF